MKIAFLSHLDLNLYLFRLPIMKELVKKGYKVYAVCPKGEVFDKFSVDAFSASYNSELISFQESNYSSHCLVPVEQLRVCVFCRLIIEL